MRFLLDKWRRIGTKLYLALGIAVILTLVSGAVAVYYFEQSGDLNFRVRSESVPALEAAWTAAREAERLRSIGLSLAAQAESGFQVLDENAVGNSLQELDAALSDVSGVEDLAPYAQEVSDAAYKLAGIVDNLALNWDVLLRIDEIANGYRVQLTTMTSDIGESQAALTVLLQVLDSGDETQVQALWEEFARLYATGIDPRVTALGEGEGIFYVRGQQLVLRDNIRELAAAFDASSAILEDAVARLLTASRAHSTQSLNEAVSSFDEGRTLLTGISVISVIVATLAAWLWVGNGMVRRLSRMSGRMRRMAEGDLETPVPEVGTDEIGELASALEVFREQALEVQRLNLVEKLYEELRQTNAELKDAQARLIAQEKLAALGELVSGVAHEIRNPLNFVNNFSEGTLELYNELTEMLETYRDKMSTDDAELLDDIGEEMNSSLNRVLSNGGRALAIVERMRGLGVVGGEPVSVELSSILRDAVQAGTTSFADEEEGFEFKTVFDLDPDVGQVLLVETDFGEAVVNIVRNAGYAMQLRKNASGEDYEPVLAVSTRLQDGMAKVRIRDNGTGIDDDVLGQIFNPFFTTREGIAGAGLGLPIAADVARRLGGDLSVDTEFGEYTEFTFTLPAAEKYFGTCRTGPGGLM
jgi:signal transduction histidine kinase